MMPSRFIATHLLLSKIFLSFFFHLRYQPFIQVLNLTVRWRYMFVLSTVDGVHVPFGLLMKNSGCVRMGPLLICNGVPGVYSVDIDFKEN